MTNSPYHPAYGLPDDFRQAVIRAAKQDGAKAAAAAFNVAASTVYKWARDFEAKTCAR
jgi:transposase-like protein